MDTYVVKMFALLLDRLAELGKLLLLGLLNVLVLLGLLNQETRSNSIQMDESEIGRQLTGFAGGTRYRRE